MTAERLRLPVAMAVLACSAPALAEEVYDFGKGLIDRIGLVDLAKEYFDRAARDESLTAEERIEAVLGLGVVLKALADRETDPGERERLYDQAMKRAADFLKEAGRLHPKRAAASHLIASIQRGRARAKMGRNGIEADSASKRQLLSAAHEACEKTVKPRADERKKAWERFQGVEREYQEQDWNGGRLRHKRNRLARKAAEKMQLYCRDVLKLAELLDEDSDERTSLIESLTKDLTREVEGWNGDEFRGVQLSVRFFLGRACALAGDYERAARDGFDHILKEDHSLYRDQGYVWVRALKLHAYYFKAKAAFDAEEYDDAVRTVDAMLNPPHGFPDARVEDIGKAALFLKSEAIARLSDSAGEDQKARLSPSDLFYSGHGHYRRALAAREQGDAGEAEREFELAIDDLRDAIRACRRPGTSFLTRCRYEPRCWSRMALAYHHLGLHYESALCFDAVVKYFSPDVVGKELRRRGQYEALAERIRDRLTEENGEELADEMVHPELFDELSTRKGYEVLRDLKEHVRKAAHDYEVALGNSCRRGLERIREDVVDDAAVTDGDLGNAGGCGIITDPDERLRRLLKRVDRMIELGMLGPEEREAKTGETFRTHLEATLRLGLMDLAAIHKHGRITKGQYEAARYRYVRRYLYSCPIKDASLRKKAEELGLLDDKFHGCNVEILDEQARKLAIELKLLAEDGKKLPEAPPAER